jgi:hypothetical protein
MTAQNPAIVDNVFVSPRACGECNACCHLYDIAALQKPAHVLCQHYAAGVGCKIHATKPDSCSGFQCLWTFAAPLDERWRPDRCRFVMRPGPAEEVVIDVFPAEPDAWKREPFYSQIRGWSLRQGPGPHRMVLVRDKGHVFVVFPEGEIDLGAEQPNTPIQSGYVLRNGRNQPYAHYGNNPNPPPAPPRPGQLQ